MTTLNLLREAFEMKAEHKEIWDIGKGALMPEYKLHPSTKKAWVKRLRSGEYLQGSGALFQYPESGRGAKKGVHCCLGVLCHMKGISNEDMETLGMPDEAGYMDMTEEVSDIMATLNDEHQATFKQIAVIVEEYL